MLQIVDTISHSSLQFPSKAVVNPARNHLIVANTSANNLLVKDLTSGSFSALGMFGSDSQQEGMIAPISLATDGQDSLYVLDSGNKEVDCYRFDPSTGEYHYDPNFLGGNRGTFNGKALSLPSDIIFDAGHLYVLDAGNQRVVQVTLSQGSSSEAVADGNLSDPTALAIDSVGDIYIADAGAHVIFKYSQGARVLTLGGYGTSEGQFRQPGGVTVTSNDDFLVSDTGNQRIQRFSAQGSYQETIGSPVTLGSPGKLSATGGRVYVADAGRVAIHVLGTSVQGPLLELDGEVVEFGFIEEGYSLRLPIALRNIGSAPLQISAVSSDNPAFIPENQTFSVSPDSNVSLIVKFSPSKAQFYSGSLTITSSSTVGSTRSVLLRGIGQPAKPIDIALVLDRSGSMRQMAGNQSKMELLKQATSLFIDLMRAGHGDRLAVISYNAHARTDHALEPVTDTPDNTRSAAKFAVSRIAPGGSTSIGAGILTARSQFPVAGAADAARRVVVVVSDGMENQPPYVAPENATDPSVDLSQFEDLDFYSVGLGLGMEVDLQVLNQLSTHGDKGNFYLTETEWLYLQKFFIEIFADAAGEYIAFDPRFVASGTKPVTVSIPIGYVDRIATFVVSWGSPEHSLYLHLVTPDGDEIHPGHAYSNERIESRSGETYLFLRVRLPLLTGAKSAHGGEWLAVVTAKLDENESIPFELSTIVKSDLGISCNIKRDGNRTGQVVELRAETTISGISVLPKNISFALEGPRYSRGEVLSDYEEAVEGKEVDADYGKTVFRRQLASAVKSDKRLRERSKCELEWAQKGSKESPSYCAETPSLENEGYYRYRIVAEVEQSGLLLRRECAHGFALISYPSGEHSSLKIEEIEHAEDASWIRIQFTPRDQLGNLIGPGEQPVATLSGGDAEVGQFRAMGHGSYVTEAQIQLQSEATIVHLPGEHIPRSLPRLDRTFTERGPTLINRLTGRTNDQIEPDLEHYRSVFITVQLRGVKLSYSVLSALMGESGLSVSPLIPGGGKELD